MLKYRRTRRQSGFEQFQASRREYKYLLRRKAVIYKQAQVDKLIKTASNTKEFLTEIRKDRKRRITAEFLY